MTLTVLIVGGGLAGLATALVLRRAGHEVQIFESSQLAFKDTAGPIVHVGPKTNDIMREWGFDATTAQGILVEAIDEFNKDGSSRSGEDNAQPPGWEYYDRSKLHKGLFNATVASTGYGKPVKISLGSRVTSVDAAEATVRLEDGRRFQGDVVLGADGIHSIARQSIRNNIATVSAGSAKVAVYFSVAITPFVRNSVAKRFLDRPKRYEKWFAENFQLNVYYFGLENLVFDCAIPTQGQGDIAAKSLKNKILESFQSDHQDLLQLISAVKLDDIHFWTQSSLPSLDKWTSKHLVLVGDAAHPFFSHEKPGTSQTLNDAELLRKELGTGIATEQIEKHLTAWEIARKRRVMEIQKMERES